MTTCGPEQEYFLIDRNFYFARPDLINAGRTLFGAQAAEGPGARGSVLRRDSRARARVHARRRDRALQGRRAGEDAPQRSRAEPVRARADLRERQRRHRPPDDDDGGDEAAGAEVRPGRACCTRSRSPASTAAASTSTGACRTTSGNNLLNPGDTPHENIQFLVFCAAMLRAVNKWQGLLRMSIASAGNDHRLGANEAPPAIISIFLGDMLTDIFEQIEKGGAKRTKSGGLLDTGVVGAAEAAARRRRPQPHEPVRVHRQQVRVPRRVVESEHRVPEHRAQRRDDRVARLRRHPARGARSRRASRSTPP